MPVGGKHAPLDFAVAHFLNEMCLYFTIFIVGD